MRFMNINMSVRCMYTRMVVIYFYESNYKFVTITHDLAEIIYLDCWKMYFHLLFLPQ